MSGYTLKSQATYLMIGKFFAFGVTSISPIILTRLMTTSEFGIYRKILFISTLAFALMSFDIHKSLYYLYPRMKGELSKVFSQTLLFLAITGLMGVLVVMILGLFFEYFPKDISKSFILPMTIWFAIENFAYILDHVFVLEKKSRMVFSVNCMNVLFRLCFVLSAFLYFRQIIAIIYALAVFSSIRLIFLLGYLVKNYKIHFFQIDRSAFIEQLKYTGPLAAGIVLWMIGGNLDKIIIGTTMTTEDFAIYTIGGLGILSGLMLVHTSIGEIMVPKFGELAVANNYKKIKELWHHMIITNAAITVPVLCFCCVFADQIISILFTEKYVESANILRINLIILFINLFGYGYILFATGKTKIIFFSQIGRMVVFLAVGYILITHYGLYGAAMGYNIALSSEAIIQLNSSRKIVHSTIIGFFPWTKLFTIAAISAIATIPLLYVVTLNASHIWKLLLGSILFFPAIFFLFSQFGIIRIENFKGLFSRTIAEQS